MSLLNVRPQRLDSVLGLLPCQYSLPPNSMHERVQCVQYFLQVFDHNRSDGPEVEVFREGTHDPRAERVQ